MKNQNRIQIIDLRFQVDHINPKKNELHQENRGASSKARLFMILIKQIEYKMKADGNKITEVKVI